jgi:glycyl-tRNA synthetase beta chain
MPDFLLEIGCEEIPARMIDAASQEWHERVNRLLERERLSARGTITYFDTPRRLAVLAPSIPAVQPDLTEQVTGPAVSVAFKDGKPTAAAHAFAKKAGVEVAHLKRVSTPKGEYLSAQVTRKGRTAGEILAEVLPKEIAAISWPKSMYWRAPGERFVRPVRWLVAMLDSEVVALEFAGIKAGNTSRGHRILSDGAVRIPHAGAAYVDALRGAKVLSRGAREQQIREALDAATRTIPGARWREDKTLLDTVVNLTEFPSVILGSFDREFLELPEEVLVTVMRDHQKYFAVEDANCRLLPHFLAVLNTDGDPRGIMRHGHERVLRARFNDARFFWQTDQKHPLRERTEWLKHVTFQKDLGSYYEKTLRVQRLCSWLSETIRQSGMQIRPGVIHKAAYLAKTDLTTELVKEFTELQGIVGGLYARVQELDRDMPDSTRRAIADAIYDHYKPESIEDSVPRTVEGAVLSIADKADTIAGMFALGLQPTGSKDPFALRRQANGIVRILAEKQIRFSATELWSLATSSFTTKEQLDVVKDKLRNTLRPLGSGGMFVPDEEGTEGDLEGPALTLAHNLGNFFIERLQFYLRDHLGYRYDIVAAVTTSSSDDVIDARNRSEAVTAIVGTSAFQSIAVAFKRMHNILRQAREKSFSPAPTLRPDLFNEVERDLYREMQPIGTRFLFARNERRYLDALTVLVALAPWIDAFFDKVMVMVEDSEIRANRLRFLNQLVRSFGGIAHFSEIVTEGKS